MNESSQTDSVVQGQKLPMKLTGEASARSTRIVTGL